MKNFMTIKQVEDEIKALNQYMDLVHIYKPKTIKQKVIFQYAITGDIVEVAKRINAINKGLDTIELTSQDVSEIIMSWPDKDDYLHKTIKRLYLKKTRGSRRKGTLI